MKDRIEKLLRELVACDSISCTEKENSASEYVYDRLKGIPYFTEHKDLFGKYMIPNDPHGRFIPYGLVVGNKPDTCVLSGHTDVVSADVYGEAKDLAFTLGKELEDALSKMSLNSQQREDLESGEWIWGRGAADMKAGVVLNLCLTEEYSNLALEGKLEGSILFMAVPDEESYSAGMRAAANILKEMKDQHDLDYKLLICPEPAAESEGKQVMSLGTVGKVMPVIITQGEVAHLGHVFNGISGLNMLNGIFEQTNGSLQFCDAYEGEATMPPMWQKMRDMKELYDASVPYRGCGYFTVLSFDTTVDETIDKIVDISKRVMDQEIKKLDNTYQTFKKMNKFEHKKAIEYDVCVYTVDELVKELKEEYGAKFDDFYKNAYAEAKSLLDKGENYPNVTIDIMEKLLNFADIKKPLVLIGLAPPYYPATHSDMVLGKEGFGKKLFDYAKGLSEDKYDQPITYENYFLGISDNSYSAFSSLPSDAVKRNYPLWGDIYEIDFDTIKEISMPSILYGPVGKEYHQWTERVNKKSLFEVMPNMLKHLIEFAWKN